MAPISGIGYHWQLQKNTPFPAFLGKSSRDLQSKNTPFPEKMGIHMRPLICIRVGTGIFRVLFYSCFLQVYSAVYNGSELPGSHPNHISHRT